MDLKHTIELSYKQPCYLKFIEAIVFLKKFNWQAETETETKVDKWRLCLTVDPPYNVNTAKYPVDHA